MLQVVTGEYDPGDPQAGAMVRLKCNEMLDIFEQIHYSDDDWGVQSPPKRIVFRLGSMCLGVEEETFWVVVSNIFYFHPGPWGNDPI